MLEQINKENFQHMLSRFSTTELEGMIEKFPYFQQAHLLLAKKYQLENSPKFDQQLQLAALYTQDRELFYNLFNPKRGNPVNQPQVTEPIKQEEEKREEVITITTIEVEEVPTVVEKMTIIITDEETDLRLQIEQIEESAKRLSGMAENITTGIQESVIEPVQLQKEEEQKESFVEPVVEETQQVIIEESTPERVEDEKPLEVFSRFDPHTFGEWLKAFNNKSNHPPEEKPVEEENAHTEDDELTKLMAASASVDYLHEIVKEETTYAKGLEKFIEEQIQKHKHADPSKTLPDNDLYTEPATETMARVYEMQKKYGRAIKTYEALTLKFPEKSSLFAARINYLKNLA